MTEVFRWTARVLSVGLVFLVVFFAFGEGVPRPWALPAPVAWQMSAMLAMLCGLVAAWWWPAVGGAIVLAGMAAFQYVEWQMHRQPTLGWVFVLFVAAGILHLLSAWPHHGTAGI